MNQEKTAPDKIKISSKLFPKNLSIKTLIFSAAVWFLCIVVFGISLIVATGGFRGQVDSTNFGNSNLFTDILIGSIGIGVLSFIVAVLSMAAALLSFFKLITFHKSLLGIIFFVPKFFLVMATLPLILIWRIFRQSKTRFGKKFLLAAVVGATLLPVWVGVYIIVGKLGAYQLGYIPEDTTIVGTGSMYPTWPKGDAGKTPAELTKQIVGTAGFLRYPNGLVVFEKRIFGHDIGRGDIITFRNLATEELTEKTSGDPAGLLKRVIALAGDTIELRDGLVYLNDTPIKEQYVAKPHTTFGEAFLKECQKVTVPENNVFAMGDNRMGSADSREIGFVPISDIDYILPYRDQKGKLDKNWHDTTNDLDDSSKPKIDRNQFVELLNAKRKENGAGKIEYDTKLEKSAELRGKAILKFDDYTYEATISGYPMEKSMADAGYWNSYWWEVIIPGYYDADGLIEDYLDRDTSDAKKNWFDKKFQDIGIAEVEGTVNGCPTQVIIVQVAGYIPATYDPDVVQSWRDSLNNLNDIIPSWEKAKGWDYINQQDLARLLDLLYRERTIASNILSKEEARQWLSKADNDSIDEYEKLAKESFSLANKLNGK